MLLAALLVLATMLVEVCGARGIGDLGLMEFYVKEKEG